MMYSRQNPVTAQPTRGMEDGELEKWRRTYRAHWLQHKRIHRKTAYIQAENKKCCERMRNDILHESAVHLYLWVF